jgi:hypothetical protein
VEAAKHGATFLGNAPTYKYGLFRLADGREVEIHLYHVRNGQWPRDMDQFLARQALSRGRNRDVMLTRIQALAQEGGARLLDPQWEGSHHWYSFEIPDGRVVKIRGSKLITTGWPSDIDAYITWSTARRQSDSEPRTKEELFQEFKDAVERNNAVVLSPAWLGARKPHHVLLSDGTVRGLKPNQLKYIGWPAVPLDELRKLAAPYPVHILPDTANQETQIFRINVSCGVYLEGSFTELKAQWAEAPALIAETIQWAASEKLRMVPAKWLGVHAAYEFITEGGTSVRRELPAAAAHDARRNNDAELAKLRRVGTMHGATLVSTRFAGKDAAYDWKKDGKGITATAQDLIEASRTQARFQEVRSRAAELGLEVELLSTDWQGLRAAYRWRLADGSEVTARLSQLRLLARTTGETADPRAAQGRTRAVESVVFGAGASGPALELLRDWGDGVGIKLLSTDWVDPGASYEWALPDGTVVAASLKKVRNCTRAVLRQRAVGDVAPQVEEAVLTTADCSTLREKIAQSKSR